MSDPSGHEIGEAHEDARRRTRILYRALQHLRALIRPRVEAYQQKPAARMSSCPVTSQLFREILRQGMNAYFPFSFCESQNLQQIGDEQGLSISSTVFAQVVLREPGSQEYSRFRKNAFSSALDLNYST